MGANYSLGCPGMLPGSTWADLVRFNSPGSGSAPRPEDPSATNSLYRPPAKPQSSAGSATPNAVNDDNFNVRTKLPVWKGSDASLDAMEAEGSEVRGHHGVTRAGCTSCGVDRQQHDTPPAEDNFWLTGFQRNRSGKTMDLAFDKQPRVRAANPAQEMGIGG